MNLLQKILVPVGISFTIVLVIMILIFKTYFNRNFENFIASEIELKTSDVTNNIDRIAVKAMLNSASYSGLKTIKNAMADYVKTKNLDSATFAISDKYKVLVKDFSNITNSKFNLAFYSNNGVCIYRSWDNSKGDDVLEKRKIVKDVILTHKFAVGIENDEWGCSIFGATPVFGDKNNLIGVIETRLPLTQLLKNTNLTKKENMAILIENNYYSEATKMDKSAIHSPAINNLMPIETTENFIIQNINTNDVSNFSDINYIEEYAYYSVQLKSYSNKDLGLVVFQSNISEYLKNKTQVNYIVFLTGFLALLIIIIILIILGRKTIKYPVREIINSLNLLSEGVTSNEIAITTKDEIAEINQALNKLNKGYNRLAYFATDIGNNVLNTEFTKLSDKDEIGNALLEMRTKLIDAKEKEEIRQSEDQKRNWATKGFADFGDILRQNTNDIELFASNIIKNLVTYTESNQGGLFIINENDTTNITLDLASAYAYNRKKHIEKQIKLGEGLVGTCAIEKETVYITNIPDDYINITSGLGTANPRNILLVPLKIEEKVFGVIEIASFKIYEKYQIEFAEKLAENIASSLSTAKTNIITAQLLEQAQQQQEEMKAQEEEMRQNMEEMQATQEQTQQQQEELKLKSDELQNEKIRAEELLTQHKNEIAKLRRELEKIAEEKENLEKN